MNDADEKSSPKGISTCKQARYSKRVREEDDKGEEAAQEGCPVDEAELRYWNWKDQSSEER